jgi:hypothetical protein
MKRQVQPIDLRDIRQAYPRCIQQPPVLVFRGIASDSMGIRIRGVRIFGQRAATAELIDPGNRGASRIVHEGRSVAVGIHLQGGPARGVPEKFLHASEWVENLGKRAIGSERIGPDSPVGAPDLRDSPGNFVRESHAVQSIVTHCADASSLGVVVEVELESLAASPADHAVGGVVGEHIAVPLRILRRDEVATFVIAVGHQ